MDNASDTTLVTGGCGFLGSAIVRALVERSCPGLDAELAGLDAVMATEDASEGIHAFIQRRRPVFRGR